MHKAKVSVCSVCEKRPSMAGYYKKFNLCSACYSKKNRAAKSIKTAESLAVITADLIEAVPELEPEVMNVHLYCITTSLHAEKDMYKIGLHRGDLAGLMSQYKQFWHDVDVVRFSFVRFDNCLTGLKNLLRQNQVDESGWYTIKKDELLTKFDGYVAHFYKDHKSQFGIDLIALNLAVLDGATQKEILIKLERLAQIGDAWLGSVETPKNADERL